MFILFGFCIPLQNNSFFKKLDERIVQKDKRIVQNACIQTIFSSFSIY